jgi:DHA1 family bicyclomycin/chloramphenicol resistance-like MFS transporter
VLSHGRFGAAAGAAALNFAGMFLYISSAPALLLTHLHLKETQFFWLFGPMTAGMMLGSAASGRLAGVATPWQTVAAGYVLMGLSATANLVGHALTGPALPWSILPLSVYAFGMSLAMPSLTLFGLDLFPHRKGLASSCQAFVLTAGNALTAGILSPWAGRSTTLLAGVQFCLLVAGGGSTLAFLRLGGAGRTRHH